VLFVPHDWRLALATVLLAGIVDATLGEPPNALHPVVWMGRLIGALERRRPRGRPGAEFACGVLIVLVTAGAASAAGLVLTLVLDRLPWGIRLWPIVIAEGVFITACSVAAWRRRRRSGCSPAPLAASPPLTRAASSTATCPPTT